MWRTRGAGWAQAGTRAELAEQLAVLVRGNRCAELVDDDEVGWVDHLTEEGGLAAAAITEALERRDQERVQRQGSPAAESDLAGTVTTEACTIGEPVSNPNCRPCGGDAAFLAAGTELRGISGYRRDFRLAAWEDSTWHAYEVDDVPDADTGEDPLDLRDKVTAVHLVEGDRGEGILKTVDDKDRCARCRRAAGR